MGQESMQEQAIQESLMDQMDRLEDRREERDQRECDERDRRNGQMRALPSPRIQPAIIPVAAATANRVSSPIDTAEADAAVLECFFHSETVDYKECGTMAKMGKCAHRYVGQRLV